MNVNKFLFGSAGIVLLLPPTLLCLFLLIGALVSGSILPILVQLAASYSFFTLWRVFFGTLNSRRLAASGLIKIGWGIAPVYGLLLIGLKYQGLLKDFYGLYYFALAPTLFLILSIYTPLQHQIQKRENFSFHSVSKAEKFLTKLWTILGYLWLIFVMLCVMLALLDSYGSHDIHYVGRFLIPSNLLNWLMILIMISPGFFFLKLGKPSWRR